MSFADTHAAIGKMVRQHFPKAEACTEWGVDGWKVWVQDEPDDWKGTASPTHLFVLPAQKKAGITIHIWDPRNWELLQEHRESLEEAGFKVMVGCIQWNRKAELPVDVIELVLGAAQ